MVEREYIFLSSYAYHHMITSLNFRASGIFNKYCDTKYNNICMSQVNSSQEATKYNVLSYYLYRRNVETFKPCINIQFKETFCIKNCFSYSTYIGCLPKLFPNVYALICFPVVLPLAITME